MTQLRRVAMEAAQQAQRALDALRAEELAAAVGEPSVPATSATPGTPQVTEGSVSGGQAKVLGGGALSESVVSSGAGIEPACDAGGVVDLPQQRREAESLAATHPSPPLGAVPPRKPVGKVRGAATSASSSSTSSATTSSASASRKRGRSPVDVGAGEVHMATPAKRPAGLLSPVTGEKRTGRGPVTEIDVDAAPGAETGRQTQSGGPDSPGRGRPQSQGRRPRLGG